MATDTLVQEQETTGTDAWSGGKQPFKASYGKLMMWYFLLSDAFTFSGFLIAYGALRFSSPTWPVPDFVFQTAPFGIEGMPLIFVTFMSFLLIISSVTMVRAVQEGARSNQGGVVFWMLLTIIGGAGFLGCQAWEWTNLIGTEGMTAQTNPFSSFVEDGTYATMAQIESYAGANGWEKVTETHDGQAMTFFVDDEGLRYFEKEDHHGHKMAGETFGPGDSYLITYHHGEYMNGAYLTTDVETGQQVMRTEEFGPKAFGALFFGITGFHGFHVFSGVLFLTIIMINVASGLYHNRNNEYEMVEKIGLYWHFVDLVWVFVFLVFYLL